MSALQVRRYKLVGKDVPRTLDFAGEDEESAARAALHYLNCGAIADECLRRLSRNRGSTPAIDWLFGFGYTLEEV